MNTLALMRLTLLERAPRIFALCGFAILFIASGLAARAIAGEGGHVEMGELYLVGGAPLVSALMLLGWLLGKYPLIATLALLAGLYSDDRASGLARIYAVRPVSFVRLYGLRFVVLLAAAFGLSALLFPVFDIIMLGEATGPAVFVVIACYVILYGGVMALLSVFARNEAWIALSLAIAAMVWNGLQRGDALAQAPPGVREVVSFILPPQGPLFRVEAAFSELQPVPWIDVAYVCGYGLVLMLAAAVFVSEREI